MGHQRLEQVLIPAAAALPDTVSLLKKIRTPIGNWPILTELKNAFSPISIKDPLEAVFFHFAKPETHLHCHTSMLHQLFSPVS